MNIAFDTRIITYCFRRYIYSLSNHKYLVIHQGIYPNSVIGCEHYSHYVPLNSLTYGRARVKQKISNKPIWYPEYHERFIVVGQKYLSKTPCLNSAWISSRWRQLSDALIFAITSCFRQLIISIRNLHRRSTYLPAWVITAHCVCHWVRYC